MSIYWLTYETHPHVNPRGSGSYKKLSMTCKKKGISSPLVMGANQKWTGFSAKWRNVYKFCKEIAKPDDIVIVTDARDVLCNRDMRGFVTAFNKVSDNGNKLVFGPEVGCCVDPMKEYGPGEIHNKSMRKLRRAENSDKWFENEGYADVLDGSGYYNRKWTRWFDSVAPKNAKSGVALNAGMGVGKASKWRKIIPKLKIESDKEDDQTLWSSLFWTGKASVTLDYGAKIFTNTNVWDSKGCFVSWDPKRKSWRNRRTRTYSYIIQTPGAPNDIYKNKAWSCYNEIYSNLRK